MKNSLNPIAIEKNVEQTDHRWLKPAEVAAITGLDEKWLAAAREGRKGINGPPYRKLGSGKTSPVRYPLNELIEWMHSFPLQGKTQASPFSSYSDFQQNAINEPWPFVLYEDGTLDEIFAALNGGRFMNEYRTRQIIWISRSALSNLTAGTTLK